MSETVTSGSEVVGFSKSCLYECSVVQFLITTFTITTAVTEQMD